MVAKEAPALSPVSVAVYAGTFDPVTNGHLDIVTRALKVFAKLHVAVAASTQKHTLFSGDQRLQFVRDAVQVMGIEKSRIVVEVFDGLLVDYVRKVSSHVIIRGLRAISDYEYEAQMAHINRYLADDIETVFLVTSDSLSFVSSSIVKEIARNGGSVAHLVPGPVASALAQSMRSEQNKG